MRINAIRLTDVIFHNLKIIVLYLLRGETVISTELSSCS